MVGHTYISHLWLAGDFYRRLFGWTMEVDEPGWVVLRPPGGGHTLNFQTEPRYVRPNWPRPAAPS